MRILQKGDEKFEPRNVARANETLRGRVIREVDFSEVNEEVYIRCEDGTEIVVSHPAGLEVEKTIIPGHVYPQGKREKT